MKQFGGKVLFLDIDDINTDEIIPGTYLSSINKDDLRPHVFEGLSRNGFCQEMLSDVNVIVSRSNFGCGSSREHAPWALEVNNINLIIAENFARIFRQNMFSCGMLAIELDPSVIDELFSSFAHKDCSVSIDLATHLITISAEDGSSRVFPFTLPQFYEDVVRAGGLIDYVIAKY